MPIIYRTYEHQIADACATVHCHWHNVDEPDDKAFLCCLECGHVYRTKRELRRAFRRASLRHLDRHYPWFRSNSFYPSVVRILWDALTVRVDRITFCQLCLHDF